MTKKQALTDLLVKVEAGDENAVSTAIRKMESEERNTGERFPGFEMRKAYGGSLDAAKVLHEMVLPDCSWFINSAYRGGEPEAAIEGNCISVEVNAEIPARAWLIAILKAMIAEAGE